MEMIPNLSSVAYSVNGSPQEVFHVEFGFAWFETENLLILKNLDHVVYRVPKKDVVWTHWIKDPMTIVIGYLLYHRLEFDHVYKRIHKFQPDPTAEPKECLRVYVTGAALAAEHFDALTQIAYTFNFNITVSEKCSIDRTPEQERSDAKIPTE